MSEGEHFWVGFGDISDISQACKALCDPKNAVENSIREDPRIQYGNEEVDHAAAKEVRCDGCSLSWDEHGSVFSVECGASAKVALFDADGNVIDDYVMYVNEAT